jgi:tRNA-specific 2-thiouridylase
LVFFVRSERKMKAGNKNHMKIAVGLSGGVDSSVACFLLKEQGYDLIGLTMKIWDNAEAPIVKKSACFGPDEESDIEDARELAATIGIPFYVIDLSREYRESIIGYFKEEYSLGRTPNPCMRCNRSMKFNLLLEKAAASGISFDKFATGHYAQVLFDEARSRYLLKKGIDEKKDQSYFLALLSQEQLGKVVFPLGGYTKQKVKEIAQSQGFKSYHKKESQDFYSGNYEELLDSGPNKGQVVDKNGKILGTHNGIFRYTIGQRRGIGVSGNTPLYVTGIDSGNNTVVVGPDEELFKKSLIVRDCNWIGIESLYTQLPVRAKIRYMHAAQEATIKPFETNDVSLEFAEPQRAITPGQYAVFYDEDDCVLGAGVIDRAVD